MNDDDPAFSRRDDPGGEAPIIIGDSGPIDLGATQAGPVAGETVATPVPGGPSGAAPRVAPAIPGFEILGELGRGGMGVVYRARRHLLNRPCALKMILAGEHAGPESLVRFLAEAEAVARVRHPNIIQIYSIGHHAGFPYLELEFADGGSLDRRLDGAPWPPRVAARLVEPLARALGEAHRLGIIHRDLKPANVLILADGTPKVGDFGLVKGIDSGAGLTLTDSILGSPSYMAPEQADGRHGEVGPAVDIYGLGALLYELLTGRPPFRGATALLTLAQVRSVEPVRPGRLVPGLPRDVETIALRCLEKAPARRYATADELADDLRRYVDGEPIRARPVPAWERAAKWGRRRPGAAAALGAIALLVAALLGLAAYSYVEIGRALASARQTAAREAATRAASDRLSADLSLRRGVDLAAAGRPGPGLLWMAEALRIAPVDAESAPLRRAADLNFAAWRGASARARAIFPHPGGINMLAVAPDGRALATAGEDGTIRLWDAATGRHRGAPIVAGAPVASVAFVAGGATLVAAGDRFLALYDAATGAPRVPTIAQPGKALAWAPPAGPAFAALVGNEVTFRSTATGAPIGPPARFARLVFDCDFAPDGRLALVAAQEGVVVPFDMADGRPAGPPLRHDGPVTGVAFAPDGRRFATATGRDGDRPGALRVFEVGREEPTAVARFEAPGGFRAVAFRPDGRAILATGENGDVLLRDATTGGPIGATATQVGAYLAAFSPDGMLAAVGDTEGQVQLWDAADGRPVGGPIEHGAQVRTCAFGPDGRTLFTAGRDGQARAHDVAALAAVGPASSPLGGLDAAEFAPDGRLLATAGADGTARLLDATTGRPVGPPLAHGARVRVARFSPDGRLLATTGNDAAAHLWDVATGRPIGPALPMGHWGLHLAFSPDGRALLVGRVEGVARLWDVATGRPIGPPLLHPSRAPGDDVWHAAFDPAGRVAITASTDGTVGFWDAATGAQRGDFLRLGATIERIIPHPDGRRVFVAARGEVHAYDLDARAEAHPPFVVNTYDMALAPDGRSLLVGGRDRAARLIDAATGRPIGPTMDQGADVTAVAFSPDGRTLLVALVGGEARFWDAATCRPIGPRATHGFAPGVAGGRIARAHQRLGFHPSGRFAVGCQGTLAWWPVPASPAATDPAATAVLARAMAGQELDGAGGLRPLDPAAWAGLVAAPGPPGVGDADGDDGAWHDRWAGLAERRGQPGAAAWHLDRLAAARPGDWSIVARRARARRRLGDEAGARDDEARATSLAPADAWAAWRAHEARDGRR